MTPREAAAFRAYLQQRAELQERARQAALQQQGQQAPAGDPARAIRLGWFPAGRINFRKRRR